MELDRFIVDCVQTESDAGLSPAVEVQVRRRIREFFLRGGRFSWSEDREMCPTTRRIAAEEFARLRQPRDTNHDPSSVTESGAHSDDAVDLPAPIASPLGRDTLRNIAALGREELEVTPWNR